MMSKSSFWSELLLLSIAQTCGDTNTSNILYYSLGISEKEESFPELESYPVKSLAYYRGDNTLVIGFHSIRNEFVE